jgi:hypothetical protein
MYVLTPTQANGVRGLTVMGHAIAPKPFVASGSSRPALLNNNFGLPEQVLVDEYHLAKRIELAGLPKINETLVPDSDWSTDAALLAQCSYNSSWPVGELITVNRP